MKKEDIKKSYLNKAKLGLAVMIVGSAINLYGFSDMVYNYLENGISFGMEQSSDYHQRQNKNGRIQMGGLLASLVGVGACVKNVNNYKRTKNLEDSLEKEK